MVLECFYHDCELRILIFFPSKNLFFQFILVDGSCFCDIVVIMILFSNSILVSLRVLSLILLLIFALIAGRGKCLHLQTNLPPQYYFEVL